jgi:hypothetical protein
VADAEKDGSAEGGGSKEDKDESHGETHADH